MGQNQYIIFDFTTLLVNRVTVSTNSELDFELRMKAIILEIERKVCTNIRKNVTRLLKSRLIRMWKIFGENRSVKTTIIERYRRPKS